MVPDKQEQNTEEEVRDYLARMLSNRKNRRLLAKRDGQLKNWSSMKEYYQPINKPLDLGIKAFKKMARKNVAKPYKYVLEYKLEMYKALGVFKGEIHGKAS